MIPTQVTWHIPHPDGSAQIFTGLMIAVCSSGNDTFHAIVIRESGAIENINIQKIKAVTHVDRTRAEQNHLQDGLGE